MKNSVHLLVLMVFMFLVSCKKDKNTSTPSPSPTPKPFVEYRNSFIGKYQGNILQTSQLAFYAGGGAGYVYNPVDTLDYRTDILNEILTSSTNDSMLVSSDPSNQFHINSNGNYIYHHVPISQSTQDYGYKVTFRNDSIYFLYYSYDNTHHPSYTAYTTIFIGKKQL